MPASPTSTKFGASRVSFAPFRTVPTATIVVFSVTEEISRQAISGVNNFRGQRTKSVMLVGVLGGGLQGCCIALALAERKVRVTLFDKNDALLSRAAAANEGKIHLVYMYAGDPTLSTAKTMMAGALSFAPFLER